MGLSESFRLNPGIKKMFIKNPILREIAKAVIELISILFLFSGFITTLIAALHMAFDQANFLNSFR